MGLKGSVKDGRGQEGEKRVSPAGAWIELRGMKSTMRQAGSIS
jgi:hypothetical protein